MSQGLSSSVLRPKFPGPDPRAPGPGSQGPGSQVPGSGSSGADLRLRRIARF